MLEAKLNGHVRFESAGDPSPAPMPEDETSRSGVVSTRDELVVQYLPLVHRLCRRFSNSGEPREDLFQVGTIGLFKAIGKFDPARGVTFTTYAVPVILGEIKNHLRDHGWSVKLPRKLQSNRLAVHRAVDTLGQRLARPPQVQEISEATGLTPNPPMDRDGRREDSGRGEGVTGAMIRARIWVDGRLAGGLQALLGAPMAACSGCGERDGGIGHGKRRSRTGLARVCGDVGLAGGSVADGRRQAGSGMARSRARARLNCSSQGQRRGRCRVNRRAERVIRPAKAKPRRLRVLVVTIC